MCMKVEGKYANAEKEESKRRSLTMLLKSDGKNEKLCTNPFGVLLFCCPCNSFHQMRSKGYVQTSSKSLKHCLYIDVHHDEQFWKLI